MHRTPLINQADGRVLSVSAQYLKNRCSQDYQTFVPKWVLKTHIFWGQRSRARVTKTLLWGSLHSCECWLQLQLSCIIVRDISNSLGKMRDFTVEFWKYAKFHVKFMEGVWEIHGHFTGPTAVISNCYFNANWKICRIAHVWTMNKYYGIIAINVLSRDSESLFYSDNPSFKFLAMMTWFAKLLVDSLWRCGALTVVYWLMLLSVSTLLVGTDKYCCARRLSNRNNNQ